MRISADAWVRLGPAPQGEVLTARVALPDVTDRLVCAINGEGVRHLLIPLEVGDDAVTDKESRGSLRQRGKSLFLALLRADTSISFVMISRGTTRLIW